MLVSRARTAARPLLAVGTWRRRLTTSPGSAVLLHNPACSKSRAALALLEATDMQFTVREYLKDALSFEELVSVAKRLRRRPTEFMRTVEPEWLDRFGEPPTPFSPKDEPCLRALAEAPVLLERPIFLHGPGAVVGRPPELVLALAGKMPAEGDKEPSFAVCRMDKNGEYDDTVVETPSLEGARRLIAHYKEHDPKMWGWPEHHMIRRVDFARVFDLEL